MPIKWEMNNKVNRRVSWT